MFALQLRAALELPGPTPVMRASPPFCVLLHDSKQKLDRVGVHLHVTRIYLVSQVKTTSVDKEVLSFRKKKKKVKAKKSPPCGISIVGLSPPSTFVSLIEVFI